jgi:hypothetical protein
MNTVEFWMGIALGCILALIIILAIVWFAGNANSAKAKVANDRNFIELQRRNDIGRMQCSALQCLGQAVMNLQETAVEIRDALQAQNQMAIEVRDLMESNQATAETSGNSLAIAADHLLDCMHAPPDPNCSCHISPPCNDCVDHAYVRDAIQGVKDALAAYKGGAQ